MSAPDWERIYDRYRGQTESENALYNQRILWLIYIQAFLFATLGLLLPDWLALKDHPGRWLLDTVVILIGLFGMYLGLVVKRILDHAGATLDELRDDWSALVATMPAALRPHYPHIAGGRGTVRTQGIRVLRSRFLPLSFAVVWGLILIYFSLAAGLLPQRL